MTKKFKIFFLGLLCIISYSFIHFQDKSLKETMDWIKTKIESNRGYAYQEGKKQHSFKHINKLDFLYDLSKKTITVNQYSYDFDKDKYYLFASSTCKIADLSSEFEIDSKDVSDEAGGYQNVILILKTADGGNHVTLKLTNYDGVNYKTESVHAISLELNNTITKDDIPNRLKKAFKNAIIKSGGKVEAY